MVSCQQPRGHRTSGHARPRTLRAGSCEPLLSQGAGCTASRRQRPPAERGPGQCWIKASQAYSAKYLTLSLAGGRPQRGSRRRPMCRWPGGEARAGPRQRAAPVTAMASADHWLAGKPCAGCGEVARTQCLSPRPAGSAPDGDEGEQRLPATRCHHLPREPAPEWPRHDAGTTAGPDRSGKAGARDSDMKAGMPSSSWPVPNASQRSSPAERIGCARAPRRIRSHRGTRSSPPLPGLS